MSKEVQKTDIDFLAEKLSYLNAYIFDHRESLRVGLTANRRSPQLFPKSGLDTLEEKIEAACAERDMLLKVIEQSFADKERIKELEAALLEICQWDGDYYSKHSAEVDMKKIARTVLNK